MYNITVTFGNLYLVRHGETVWSKAGQYTGRTDLPLTSNGIAQAKVLESHLRALNIKPENIFVSPLKRAQQTAQFAGLGQATDYKTNHNLEEWSYGDLEGHKVSEVTKILGRVWDIFLDGVALFDANDIQKLPAVQLPLDENGEPIAISDLAGETIGAVEARCQNFLREVLPILERGEDAVAIAHAHILRVLALVFLELDPKLGSKLRLDNCSLSCLTEVNGQRTITKWNQAYE